MADQTDGPDSRSLVGGEHSFGMERPQMTVLGTGYQALVSPQSSGLLVSRNNDKRRERRTEFTAASAILSEKDLNSLLSIWRRFRSCCSISISSSSPYRYLRLRLPVSSNCTSWLWSLSLATSGRRIMGPYVSLFLANHDWGFQMDVKDHE